MAAYRIRENESSPSIIYRNEITESYRQDRYIAEIQLKLLAEMWS